MEIKQIKIGTVLSFLYIFLTAAISLIYTPVMLKFLGQSEFGLYNTIASVISLLGVLNLGFNGSYIHFYTKYGTSSADNKLNSLNGLYIVVFSIIGLIALICGLYIATHINVVLGDNLRNAEYELGKKLMLILSVSLSLSFPFSVFSSIISANEKFIFLKTLSIIKTICCPLFTFPLFVMGFRSIAIVSVTVAISAVIDIINFIYVIIVLKYHFSFHNFDAMLLKELFSFTFFIAINLIIDQINWNMDKLIISRIRDPAEVAVYSMGYTVFSFYLSLSIAISELFTPLIHRLTKEYSCDSTKLQSKLTELFTKTGRIQFFILSFIACGFLFFGKSFITAFWAGAEYENSFYVALLLIISSTIPLIQNIGIEIQRAQNKHKFRSFLYAIMAVINLVISIALCKKCGAIGCAIGTSISLILANGLLMDIYYHKKCYINILGFWKSILLMSRGLIFPLVFGMVLYYFIDTTKISGLIIGILLYSIVHLTSMWLVSLNKAEKELFINPIKHILERLHYA